MTDKTIEQLKSPIIMYHMVNDDSSHWYIIPVTEDKDFNQWLEDVENNKKSEFDFSKNMINKWIGKVHFSDFKIT